VYVRVFLHMYVYMCVCLCVFMCLRVRVFVRVCVCVCVFVVLSYTSVFLSGSYWSNISQWKLPEALQPPYFCAPVVVLLSQRNA
jgi:hypothetical protein